MRCLSIIKNSKGKYMISLLIKKCNKKNEAK